MKIRNLCAALFGALGMLFAGNAVAQEYGGYVDSGFVGGSSACASGNCAGGAACPTGDCVVKPSPWESYNDVASRNPDGSMIANCIQHGRQTKAYPSPLASAVYAARDPFHPAPHYAYGRAGIDATRTHTWNYNQAGQYSWHGGYYHRQYGQPLALVVPPTAGYQTQYSWGVGQTKSLPIYHQFQRPNPGAGGVGGEAFAPTPYWPSNTDQFGVYPVRGPW